MKHLKLFSNLCFSSFSGRGVLAGPLFLLIFMLGGGANVC